MHWCYVSACSRTMRIARVAVMLAQCSRSRVRCEWPRHVRFGWRLSWGSLWFLLPLNVLKAI